MLLQHGIFTVGDTAEQAYDRMIEFVTMAEERLSRQRKTARPGQAAAPSIASLPEIAPILRGAVRDREESDWPAPPSARSWISAPTPQILNYVNGAELARYSQVGVVTPDHTIRTKNWPLIVPAPEAGKLEEWAKDVRRGGRGFRRALSPLFRTTTTPKAR